MYRDGLGVPRDLPKANLYFHAAAQQDLAEAQVNLGKYHFGECLSRQGLSRDTVLDRLAFRPASGMGEYATATTYFEHAMHMDGQRQPDTFQSHYYLAELNARAVNHEEQCPLAVSFYKLIAERGDWDHEVWWEAQRAYSEGDERKAFLGFWIMAERGYEPAQNNIAFMLDRGEWAISCFLLHSVPQTAYSIAGHCLIRFDECLCRQATSPTAFHRSRIAIERKRQIGSGLLDSISCPGQR